MWRTAGAGSRAHGTLLHLSMLAKHPWQEPPAAARRARIAKHALRRHLSCPGPPKRRPRMEKPLPDLTHRRMRSRKKSLRKMPTDLSKTCTALSISMR